MEMTVDRTRFPIRLRPAFAGLAVVACLAGGNAPARAATPAGGATRAQTVTVSPADPRLQLLGRWNRDAGADTTVNSGSRLLLRFTGSSVTALFDTSAITNPPQFYARIDSGPR